MTHFGIICPPVAGHLNPMLSLGKELIKRGHRVTLFGILDAKSKTVAAELEFQIIGKEKFLAGAVAKFFTQQRQATGLAAFRYTTINLLTQLAAVMLREAPGLIKAAGVEALLVDQCSWEGGTIADLLGIPFVTICNALMLNIEAGVPPAFTLWKYNPAWWARLRNQVVYMLPNPFTKPIQDLIYRYRQECKLTPYSGLNDAFSQLAQLSQTPAEFEFPRKELPPWFHFTGPYDSSASWKRIPFPYEKLTGKPLIYAAMGTLQNHRIDIFQKIASACEELDAQLVISLGIPDQPESLPKFAGNPLIVGYAPQLELLKKAALGITHAGMNTAMACLSNGVPMVAIPVTDEQPGIAKRIAWAGVGEVVPLKQLSVKRLQKTVKQVLREDFYKQNALRLQGAVQRSGGVNRAIDIIEKAVSTGKPVLAQNYLHDTKTS